MTTAYLNRIACVVPQHDIHETFIRYARSRLADNRRRSLFERMVERSEIEHRWSCLAPAIEPQSNCIDFCDFYRLGRFPSTAARMHRFAKEAPGLARQAVERLGLGRSQRRITHLIVITCTGFSAPGIDIELIRHCDLDPSVERTTVGFMGCHGTINALKLARHIVRSEPTARVLLLSIELCTLHLQEVEELDQILSYLLFGDGCGAALVTAEPEGLSLDSFHAMLTPAAGELITWTIGDSGFDMFLSGQVPASIRDSLRMSAEGILAAKAVGAIDNWAVHPGGRSILDAVETAFKLGPKELQVSRQVLRRFGNMSSATILFVLEAVMATAKSWERGCAIAFGPGLSIESMLFQVVE